MNLFTRGAHEFAGVRIVESPHMVVTSEDWSRVRSPSRAARRRRQGHRQNIRIVTVPRTDAIATADGTIFVHPSIADALRRHFRQTTDDALYAALLRGSDATPRR